MLLKRTLNNPEQLIVTFTLILLILGVTIIYLFLYIQNQKKESHFLKQKFNDSLNN
jgi:preprotein translocase subunit YajC